MDAAFAHLIDGELVAGSDHFAVVNPATGAPFARCPSATRAELERAVAAATAAFRGPWRGDDAARRETLRRMAEVTRSAAAELGRLVALEQGKPLAMAEAEAHAAAQIFDLYAGETVPCEVLREGPAGRVTLERRPLGVTAAITPWNYPLATLAMKLAPALLVGNTVVAKPSPFTPLSSLALAARLREVVPPGAVNVLGGSDQVGAWLTAHPGVRKVAFTGSIATGKRIVHAGADDLKRLTLELGGNDPAIVLPDVEVGAVAPSLFWSAFLNSGQICMAIKRIYAHRDVYEPLVAELSGLARAARVGDPLEPGTELGPVSSRAQLERVAGLVDDARRRGGRVSAGGAPLAGPGFFYPPTIVADVPADAALVTEEQFGPALPVVPFDDVDDVLAQANATHYGLCGSVWTADAERGARLARRLECGTVWVNRHMDLGHDAPFGGVKWSGLGWENGRWGIDQYCDLQVVHAPA
ncbi:MAG: aldehyde dehydrogenase family protein [Thermodesulfobacteriota bacterium]